MTGDDRGVCLDDDVVLGLVEGNLSEDQRAEADAHLDSCEVCRRLVGAAAGKTHDRHGGQTGNPGVYDRPSALRGDSRARGSLVGRYLILSLLGTGAMGEVYAAYDPDLDRRVAVKLLRTARGSARVRQRLAREARALGKLSHPNVVQVYELGEHDGDVFVAMELVTGLRLDEWCTRAPERVEERGERDRLEEGLLLVV